LNETLGVAHTLNNDMLVNVMIRAAILSLACETGEQVLNRTRLSDEQLLTLQTNIHPALVDDFEHTYLVERYFCMLMLDPIRAAAQKGGFASAKITFWNWFAWIRGNRQPVYRDEDYLLYLNLLDAHRAVQALPGCERLRIHASLEEKYRTNISSKAGAMVAPRWTKAIQSAVTTRAKLESMKTAIAVERFRSANDALPDSLSLLIPQYLTSIPRDPFDDQPLRFKRLPRGYVVYSIGADGVDDGGLERTNYNSSANYDVTFTVER
jgi:hypothetical protein